MQTLSRDTEQHSGKTPHVQPLSRDARVCMQEQGSGKKRPHGGRDRDKCNGLFGALRDNLNKVKGKTNRISSGFAKRIQKRMHCTAEDPSETHCMTIDQQTTFQPDAKRYPSTAISTAISGRHVVFHRQKKLNSPRHRHHISIIC